jgi:hypothetical protein
VIGTDGRPWLNGSSRPRFVVILTLMGASLPYITAQFVALSQMVNTITQSTQLGSVAVAIFGAFIYCPFSPGGQASLAFPTVTRFCIALLNGRGECLTARFGGFGIGQSAS